MLTHTERLQLALDRLQNPNPRLAAIEVVLLRTGIDQLDDYLLWLDQHIASDHGGDGTADAVLDTISAVRVKLARLLTHVDEHVAELTDERPPVE